MQSPAIRSQKEKLLKAGWREEDLQLVVAAHTVHAALGLRLHGAGLRTGGHGPLGPGQAMLGAPTEVGIHILRETLTNMYEYRKEK